MSVLDRLAAAIEAEGGLLAGALTGAGGEEPLVPAGPRTAAHADEYALLFAAIREGARLHYEQGRVVAPEDPDLALLGGDRLYALGLDRLARLGDLEAVAELADVISLVARAHAEGDPGRAAAAWTAGAAAIGHGRRAE